MLLSLHPDISKLLPQTEVSIAALTHAHANLPPAIFNHSLRVYLLSHWLAKLEGGTSAEWASSEKIDILFVAAIFHDMGASDLHNGHQRFEVDGADAARAHLEAHNISDQECFEAWTAIALHTSPGIAERITPLARLIRMAVLIDFRAPNRELMNASAYGEYLESLIPRLEIEKVLADTVVAQAVLDPTKAPAASWANNLLRSHLADPDFKGVNRDF